MKLSELDDSYLNRGMTVVFDGGRSQRGVLFRIDRSKGTPEYWFDRGRPWTIAPSGGSEVPDPLVILD